MANYINQFFFGIYPYIAITVFFFGSLLRYDRDQYTWKASSSQLLSKKDMRLGSNLFHIGIIMLFFGHLVGLLTPHWAYHFMISAGTKQLLAMTAGGIFGVICLVGMVLLIRRRMLDARIRATSQPTDLPILLILFVQLVLGLLTIPFSAQHMDGSSMLALAGWAQHIVTFRGDAASFVAGEAFIFKAHLVLGLTIF
ncbi:MAG: respiratory nitrate reductase subunit gamma, partial [Gammaproteobacteria bacterium]|nr:respiratory nitrate reductase subunit gamma [Gammaproteobacteria bacterium]